jgi:hypothetical protein
MKKQDVAKLNNRSKEELLKDAAVLREKIWPAHSPLQAAKTCKKQRNLAQFNT